MRRPTSSFAFVVYSHGARLQACEHPAEAAGWHLGLYSTSSMPNMA